jgi:signal peptidase II
LALDQASKHWIGRWIGAHPVRVVVPGVLHLAPSTNPGGAFGLFSSAPWLFVGVAVAAVGAALFYRRQILSAGRLVRMAVALLLGGTVGNLIDRLRFGHVQDFISVKTAALLGFDWPTFNVADIAITVGTFLFVGHLIYLEFRERAK